MAANPSKQITFTVVSRKMVRWGDYDIDVTTVNEKILKKLIQVIVQHWKTTTVPKQFTREFANLNRLIPVLNDNNIPVEVLRAHVQDFVGAWFDASVDDIKQVGQMAFDKITKTFQSPGADVEVKSHYEAKMEDIDNMITQLKKKIQDNCQNDADPISCASREIEQFLEGKQCMW